MNAEVSLFETNIRLLGGLLSAHLLASGAIDGAAHLAVEGYRGELLRLAVDLGQRLLSAFGRCDELPRPFVQLRGGAARFNGAREQCTAGVGTLLLEFGTLSRLTLDPRFAVAASCALRLLWSKRSPRDLLGNTLDVASGTWRNSFAGIGAGIDSFYEYALKSYLAFGGQELYQIWNASYAAVKRHLRVGPWCAAPLSMHAPGAHPRCRHDASSSLAGRYGQVSMYSGETSAGAFDALQAFWPALQVLAGDVEEAAATQDAFHSLWRQYKLLPERVNVDQSKSLTQSVVNPTMAYYPLRPELAESTYALYRATRDPKYIQFGKDLMT